ncbi:hypothetical protein ACH79_39765 [Bradyrhizobium sp. CCBAU 051011]|nr:hypothetical protein ACH79_39765 [Bradyrhizobium sp. CCBAU 051011]
MIEWASNLCGYKRVSGLNYRNPGTGGTVVAAETLSLPFPSWREGLLALASALKDPDRERIVVDRLETTAANIRIGPREICSLALLVPSRAHLESFPKPTPPREIARLIEVANAGGELNRLMVGMLDDMERTHPTGASSSYDYPHFFEVH